MQLTLLVPELVWPEPGDHQTLDAVRCPALTTLLARGRLARRPPQSLEATLADAFGLPPGAPYGAYRLLGEAHRPETAAASDCWLCADPVHLRFHQERIILADGSRLEIATAEAEALVAELNRWFGDVGTFHVASAERWYLRLADATRLEDFDVPPLSAVAGRRVERLLPETARTGWLRRLLNEAQMVMHGHAVNAGRNTDGRPPINSLWLWGAGALPAAAPGTAPFDSVWSTHPLALGLARAHRLPAHPPAADLAALRAAGDAGERPLVLLDDLLGPVHYEDGDAYAAALAALETRWFAPARAALASGRLRRLRILATTAYALLDWQGGRLDPWRFWQRPQPLAALAERLAREA